VKETATLLVKLTKCAAKAKKSTIPINKKTPSTDEDLAMDKGNRQNHFYPLCSHNPNHFYVCVTAYVTTIAPMHEKNSCTWRSPLSALSALRRERPTALVVSAALSVPKRGYATASA